MKLKNLFQNKSKKIVSFLVSGRGSNFKAVAKAIISGEIKAQFGILISDKKDALALGRARELGIQAIWVNPRDFQDREAYDIHCAGLFQKAGTDLVVAAGYMRILSKEFIKVYHNKIINIHPSLLPAFPGKNAQEKALDYGVKVTGCTVHFIDEGTDSGPIIAQSHVLVKKDDSVPRLSQRILKEEHKILIESVQLFCSDKLCIKGRTVSIK